MPNWQTGEGRPIQGKDCRRLREETVVTVKWIRSAADGNDGLVNNAYIAGEKESARVANTKSPFRSKGVIVFRPDGLSGCPRQVWQVWTRVQQLVDVSLEQSLCNGVAWLCFPHEHSSRNSPLRRSSSRNL